MTSADWRVGPQMAVGVTCVEQSRRNQSERRSEAQEAVIEAAMGDAKLWSQAVNME